MYAWCEKNESQINAVVFNYLMIRFGEPLRTRQPEQVVHLFGFKVHQNCVSHLIWDHILVENRFGFVSCTASDEGYVEGR